MEYWLQNKTDEEKARIEYVCNLKPEVNPQMTIFDMLGDDINE